MHDAIEARRRLSDSHPWAPVHRANWFSVFEQIWIPDSQANTRNRMATVIARLKPTIHLRRVISLSILEMRVSSFVIARAAARAFSSLVPASIGCPEEEGTETRAIPSTATAFWSRERCPEEEGTETGAAWRDEPGDCRVVNVAPKKRG